MKHSRERGMKHSKGNGLIIGLGHIKRMGKDTVARFMNQEFLDRGYSSQIVSFAQPIYDIGRMMYGHIGFRTKEEYDGDFAADKELPLPNGLSPRQILLGLGEKMREVDQLIWVQYALSKAKESHFVLIPDVRHPNECEAILDAGGYLVKVDRPIAVVMQANDIDKKLWDYDGWDTTIANRGNLDKLKEKSVALASKLMLETVFRDKTHDTAQGGA